MIYGFVLFVILLYIGLFLLIAKLFLRHIILFDSILFGVIIGITVFLNTNLHSAICLLIGIFSGLLICALQLTKYGFWIIGIIFSWLWSQCFADLALDISGNDKTKNPEYDKSL